jgi:16S rRNA (adenine1518-N6/adenine1519-N6)-dimethyltransferase
MNLGDMKQILAAGGIQLTKSLGQNFLHDGNQLRRIVHAANLTKTDRVLEIGPGLGPLTELLLEGCGEVFAIEKDRRLAEILTERFAGAKHFTLLRDDALKYLRRERRDWGHWKLAANLPYSVASPIIVELAQARDCPQRMVVTLQSEVAQRLVAQAGEDDYGILSLLIQLRYKPVGHFKIHAECFFPAPEVDSACVALERRAPPLLPIELHWTFERIVKLGFSQRRKMMMKLLKTEWTPEKLAAAFEQAGLSPRVRAEEVTLEQFIELTKSLS